jgi:long-chain acyl-CoA synthetase
MSLELSANPITLVHHFLENSAARYPDKIAFIHGKVRATYAEINNRADNLARHLISIGTQKGDRIALLMENCLEYAVSYYGIMKAGAVAVPLNSDLKVDGLRYAIRDLEAKVMISSSRFEKLISASNLDELTLTFLIAKGTRTAKLEVEGVTSSIMVVDFDSICSSLPSTSDLEPSAPSVAALTDSSPTLFPSDSTTQRPNDPMTVASLCAMPSALCGSDLASIIYTSGSTGGPKGVMLTHRNIVDNTFSICQYLHLTQDDIQMVVLPFFYVMGKSLLNTHFAAGGTIVINNQFAFPAAVIKEMIIEKVTGFSGVPSTFAYLVHRSPLAANRDKLTSLRYVSQAGGHMSKAIKEELRRVLPTHTEIVVMYGATEAAARLSFLEPSRFTDKMDSIGTAIPGVTLKVITENGQEAAVGEIGELVASGSNIMQGYWKNPEATASVLKNGWYHTGDQAYMDEEGFFFLVGRKDDLLKVGGHRLNPQEIEDILMESGFFVEAVVLGIPDELLGNKLATLGVISREECDENQVLAYCANHLPKYKIPSDFKFVKNLPKKTSGKIDRKACLSLFFES